MTSRAWAGARLVGLVGVLSLVLGMVAAVVLVSLPVPARGEPARYLVRNGSAHGLDTGEGPVWILALGSDARPGEDLLRERADAIHLIGVNPGTGAGVIVGFPRDSWVDIPGYGHDKINASLSVGGPETVAATIAAYTGIQPHYVFVTGFEGLTRMVDRLGGIVVDVPFAMADRNSGAYFDAGPVHMDGGQALAFSRNRYVRGGDFTRSKHQGDLLLATLVKMREFTQERSLMEFAVTVLLEDTATNVPPAEVYRLARVATTIDPAKVVTFVVPGGVGSAGRASIVVLDHGWAAALFDDIRDDATLDQPPPPIPNI